MHTPPPRSGAAVERDGAVTIGAGAGAGAGAKAGAGFRNGDRVGAGSRAGAGDVAGGRAEAGAGDGATGVGTVAGDSLPVGRERGEGIYISLDKRAESNKRYFTGYHAYARA